MNNLVMWPWRGVHIPVDILQRESNISELNKKPKLDESLREQLLGIYRQGLLKKDLSYWYEVENNA